MADFDPLELVPDARDGLRRSQRRALHALYEEHLRSGRPFTSCRQLGLKFGLEDETTEHAEFLEELLNLGRYWVTRYPLLALRGDAGGPADLPVIDYGAVRCRLDRLGEELFDGLKPVGAEGLRAGSAAPAVLPAAIPNLLLNGSVPPEVDLYGSGDFNTAVRGACFIPPHRINEIVPAICAVIETPNLSVEAVARMIPGPDFPSGGAIVTDAGPCQYLLTGCGWITIRGRVEVSDRHLVITEAPFEVDAPELVVSICEGVNAGALPWISDVRDMGVGASPDLEIVLELRRAASAPEVIRELFRHTLLEVRREVRMVAIADGRPRGMNIKQLIDQFIGFRCQTMVHRTESRLRAPDTPPDQLRDLPRNAAEVAGRVRAELLALQEAYREPRLTELVPG
jgi:DNA gyrase subunit A